VQSDIHNDIVSAHDGSSADITPAQLRTVDGEQAIPNEGTTAFPSRAPERFMEVTEPDYGDPEERTGSFTAELRGNLGGAYTPNNALRSSSATDNLMLGLYGHVNNSVALGAEIGKESYDQTLYYFGADTLQVEQRPSYMWFGATGRLYLGEIPFGGIETFLQGTAAYSTGGPVMRLRLGGQMPLGAGFDLTLGGETSGLIYTFKDQRFISGRWGVTVGAQWTLR
jgi:hypothetical protein